MLCTPGSQAFAAQWQDRCRMNTTAAVVKTGADGRFEFMPQVETFTIVACRMRDMPR